MPRILLISEVPLTDESSRGADFAARADMLEEHGWAIDVGLVPPPYVRSFLPSLLRCIVTAWRQDIDVVTSVSNPFHLQLIGFFVSFVTGRPWIAEFRDPMVHNPDRSPGALTTKLAAVVEWLVVHFADLVVWGDGIQMEDDYFETTYDVNPGKIRKLPVKGFRHDVFADADPVDYETFTVTYAGSFYDDWIEPYTVFKAIEIFVSRYDLELKVQFYGDWEPEYDRVVAEAGLTDVIERYAFVPKSEIIPILKGSDVLLYIGGSDPRNRLNLPSKIYDYIGAKSPVLAVVDPGFRVAELIRNEQLGVVAPYENPDAIADGLYSLRAGNQFHPSDDLYNRFSRHRKIEVLDQAYRKVLEEDSSTTMFT